MAPFWFLAGMLTALGVLILILPWLRRIPLLGPLPPVSWQVAISACVVVAVALAMYQWVWRPGVSRAPTSGRRRWFSRSLGRLQYQCNSPGEPGQPKRCRLDEQRHSSVGIASRQGRRQRR